MSVHPTEIKLHQASRILEIHFNDGAAFQLPCEYLRVFSPSAEVRGHHPDAATLVLNKAQVNITAIEPIGNYAVKLVFDDGHNSGLYSWNILHDLGRYHERNWQDYLQRVASASATAQD